MAGGAGTKADRLSHRRSITDSPWVDAAPSARPQGRAAGDFVIEDLAGAALNTPHPIPEDERKPARGRASANKTTSRRAAPKRAAARKPTAATPADAPAAAKPTPAAPSPATTQAPVSGA